MPAGRPLQYKTKEELQAVIDKYFDDCTVNRLISAAMQAKGDVTVPERPDDMVTYDEYPTVSGLGLCLGLSRQGLINYQGRKEFVDTIKNAKARIESTLEQRLYYPQPTGVIFNLKNNYGWDDKQSIDHKSSDGSMSPQGKKLDDFYKDVPTKPES